MIAQARQCKFMLEDTGFQTNLACTCLALWKHHVNLLLQLIKLYYLHGVSTKLKRYIIFTIQTYKKLKSYLYFVNDNTLFHDK